MKFFVLTAITFVTLFSHSAFSHDCTLILAKLSQKDQSQFKRGSAVNIKLPAPENKSFDGYFLGKVVEVDGKVNDLAFYVPSTNTVLIYPKEQVLLQTAQLKTVGKDQVEAIVYSQRQNSGFCGAFAAFNCMRFLGYNNHAKSEIIKNVVLQNEESRTAALVSLISDFYGQQKVNVPSNNLISTEKNFNHLGYTLKVIQPTSKADLKSKIFAELQKGHGVIITAGVQHNPEGSINTIKKSDGTLAAEGEAPLIPAQSVQNIIGHHAFLLMGAFDNYVIVLDSNRKIPRIWNMQLLDAYQDIDFHAYAVSP